MDQCTAPQGEAIMRIVHTAPASLKRRARHTHDGVAPALSRPAKARLAWFDYHRAHGGTVSLTCRHFGISRPTFYYWQRRYDPRRLETLEERSHRPRRVRERSWGPREVEAVCALRNQYPRWGKAKLAVLLARQGRPLSCSMVGRILAYARRRGLLHAPVGLVATRQRRPARPYATRKPKEYTPTRPGDLVQVDTLDVRPTRGSTLKHLSLVDVVSRYAAAEIRSAATAAITAQNLERMLARLPFRVHAVQVDGGSEFMADFEQACQRRGLRLFVLPPRSPKLNGRVERLQRTHSSEFYECTTAAPTVAGLAPALAAYEHLYNTVRPHQALDYLTPWEYLHAHHPDCLHAQGHDQGVSACA